MVNKARLIESIAGLVKEKRIDGISDLRDESDRDGMRIVIELKRDANAQVVLNRLYTFSQLQETVGVIMLAIDGKQPRVMTLQEILRSYLDFQFQVITRRTRYELKKSQRTRAHSGRVKKSRWIILTKSSRSSGRLRISLPPKRR